MSTKWRVDYRYFKSLSCYLLLELADNRHKLGQVLYLCPQGTYLE